MDTYLAEKLGHAAKLAVIAFVLVAVPAWGKSQDAKQREVRKKSQEILMRRYKEQPSARQAVEKAAGYAVFSNFGTEMRFTEPSVPSAPAGAFHFDAFSNLGMRIHLSKGGSGIGIAVDNRPKSATYMKMVKLEAGPDMDVNKFSLVWVFQNPEDLNQFTSAGWRLRGRTFTPAKPGVKVESLAGAISVSPGVWPYQLAEKGLALNLPETVTRYYKGSGPN